MKERISYCRTCNVLGPMAVSFNGGPYYCTKCRSKLIYLNKGVQVVNTTLAVTGDISGNLVIPEGVTDIFYESLCGTSIRSVQFPRSLREIPLNCFQNCRNLETITIPRTITKINGGAFEGCTRLKKVIIDGDTEIGWSAFHGCSGLKELVIGGKFESNSVFSNPFDDCSNLEKITFTRTAKIGELNLSKIPNLRKVILQCQIAATNGSYLNKGINFARCQKLEEVEFENVEKIGSATFSQCINLKRVGFRNPVKYLDSMAFYECTSLESITIPEGCVEVGGFDGCINLLNITIPKSVKKIGSHAFQDCKRFESFVVPEGVEELGYGAFEGCTNLKTIILPSTLKRIGNYAFKGCTSLEKIVLPDGVQEIGEKAFEQCSRIRSLELPASLKKIGSGAFQSLPIHLVIIPGGITELGTAVFEERWSRYSEQKHQYVVAPNAYVEGYLKENGLQYEVTFRKNGALLEAPVADGVLHYLKPKGGKLEIPFGVEIIEANAVSEQETIKEVFLSDSVREVKPNAFINCTGLERVTFGCCIEKIGSKAFPGLTDMLIELPQSIKEIAPDAFGAGCILSVGGKMPFHSARQVAIEHAQKQAKVKDASILELQRRKQTLEEELVAYINSASAEFTSIPQYQAQVFDIESRYAEHKRITLKKQSDLNAQIKQLEVEISDLSMQRDKCFFLAISKKKDLEASIQSKQKELQALQTEQKLFADESAATDSLFTEELNPAKSKLEELRSAQRRWEAGKETRMTTILGIKRDLQRYSEELLKMKTSVEENTLSLEQDYERWHASRDALILKQKTNMLLAEKATILSGLQMPIFEGVPSYAYRRRKAITEESILNKAFLSMFDAWNYESEATLHNQYVESHSSEIRRVQEINVLLGCAEDDGISEYRLMEIHPLKGNYLPERFINLCAWFAKSSHWKSFKQFSKEITCARAPKKNLQDQFFAGCDYFSIVDGDKYLLVFPYCIVKYEPQKPLAVLTYDKSQIKVEYSDRTDTGYSTPHGGELVNMEFMYLNKDGSPSKRYRNNPLIKTYRFTNITITDGRESFSFPFNTHNAALQFEATFNKYRKIFTEGEYCDIYKTILDSSDLDAVEAAIQNYSDTEKRRDEEKKIRAEAKRLAAKAAAEAEKKREEAERLAAIAAAEEEKKRIEAERLAAQAAAEEKRRAIIQRQKELNEERKRQAAEKKKIYGLFEDDPAEEAAERETKTAADAAPLEVIGKRLISNNVFKVQARQVVQTLAEDAVCYFVTENGTIISNKKKLVNSGVGNQMTIGFILASGIDYTQIRSCFMRIESQSAVLGEIDFKMNISFYSEF